MTERITVEQTIDVRFAVRGVPKGQPRPRAFARKVGGKHVARVFDAGTAEAWKSDVVRAGSEHRPECPIDEPVGVWIAFFLPRPKSLTRKKDPDGPIAAGKKPDLDNLIKSTLDAMTNDGWWRDDSLVVSVSASKRYHAKDGWAGAEIGVVSALE